MVDLVLLRDKPGSDPWLVLAEFMEAEHQFHDEPYYYPTAQILAIVLGWAEPVEVE